jgi:hypothetical protein
MGRKARKILRWLVGILALLMLLIVAAAVFRNPLLKGITCWNISRNTGLRTKIGAVDLDLAGSRLRITGFRIYNTPPFGNSVLVDIPEIYFALDAQDAARGKLHFKEVRFALAEANVVQTTNGLTNLEALKQTLEKKAAKAGRLHTNGLEFAGVDKLVVSLGKVNFVDLQQPQNSTYLDLGVKDEVVRNLKTSEDLENWATALVIRVLIQQSLSGAPEQSKTRTFEMLLKQLK